MGSLEELSVRSDKLPTNEAINKWSKNNCRVCHTDMNIRCLTKHPTILVSRNPPIDKNYEVKKRQSTDFESGEYEMFGRMPESLVSKGSVC